MQNSTPYFISAIFLAACAGQQDSTDVTDYSAPGPVEYIDNPLAQPMVMDEPSTSLNATNMAFSEVPQALSVQPSVAACSDSRVLYLWPDPSIIPFVHTAINKFALLGFNIAIETTHGVRMYEVASLPDGSQARSYWKGAGPCFYDTCTSANSHVNVTTALLQRTDTQFVVNSIEHEISHLISGFGSCVTPGMGLQMADSMHLVPGHLVSNGNSLAAYDAMTVTEQDTILLRSCL